jgi:hypothetical protein
MVLPYYSHVAYQHGSSPQTWSPGPGRENGSIDPLVASELSLVRIHPLSPCLLPMPCLTYAVYRDSLSTLPSFSSTTAPKCHRQGSWWAQSCCGPHVPPLPSLGPCKEHSPCADLLVKRLQRIALAASRRYLQMRLNRHNGTWTDPAPDVTMRAERPT